MTDFIVKIICHLGWHNWHHYRRFDLDNADSGYNARLCRNCGKQEYLTNITFKHWEQK